MPNEYARFECWPAKEEHAAKLGKGHRLNYSEAFRGAIFEIEFRLVEGQTVQQFPCRIAEIEERGPVIVFQITVIGCYPQLTQLVFEFG